MLDVFLIVQSQWVAADVLEDTDANLGSSTRSQLCSRIRDDCEHESAGNRIAHVIAICVKAVTPLRQVHQKLVRHLADLAVTIIEDERVFSDGVIDRWLRPLTIRRG